jgi:SAM-dependent methyltransferase
VDNHQLADFESVACDLCGSEDMDLLFTGPDKLMRLPGIFRVVRCRECGLVRQNPRPTLSSMGVYYPPNYASFSPAIDDEAWFWVRWDRRYGMQKRRKIVERYRTAGRLLDIGCATGNYLNELKRTGRWDVEGVEPSLSAADHARQRFGLTVHVGTMTDLNLPAKTFDVATMWNVLEHVHEPVRDLHEAHRVLQPGGLLVFAVPVVDGRLRQWFGPDWVEWDLPRHLFVFSRQTAERLVAVAGFKLIAVTAPFSEYRVFQMSLMNWMRNRGFAAAKRSILATAICSLPFRLVVTPVLKALIPPRLRSTLVFVCERMPD